MTLDEFLANWLAKSSINAPIQACQWVNGNAGVTLYRDERFQVQLWIFPPRARVTDHRHPGMDIWLVRVAGKLRFRLHGAYVPLSDADRMEWGGMKTWCLHVPPGAMHGADIGESGASFLTVAERVDGRVPESVHLIWDGPPLDEEHGRILGT